uniref:Integral membrane protein n=1 Tax=uncultured bacterium HF186_25m_30B18 TaxID=662885 RepID=C7FPA8_9BACT|nr:hypothetical protein [uncultured bacterium HF186_25m_30B18]
MALGSHGERMTPEALSWALVLAHLSATLFMTGLIWFVQVVHYPLKSSVGDATFRDYQARHVTRTGWVVGPPMLIEAMSAALLALAPPNDAAALPAIIGLITLVVVWAATALYSVPAHGRLAAGFDQATHRRLVRSNWVRTWGWSLRSGVAIWILMTMQGALNTLTGA